MIRYFSKIALRYLWHNKTYSILNYICLSFGFMCAILAVLYVLNAFSYDKFHKNYNRLYSVEALVTYFNGDRFPKQYLTASLPEIMMKNVPEIEEIARVAEQRHTFMNGERTFEMDGLYADANFFKVFDFPLISGSFGKTGSDPNSIVISSQMAMMLFETMACTGKMLVMKDGDLEQSFKISGVFNQVPAQSTLSFDYVIPFSRFLADNPWAYETGATSNLTWILLNKINDKNTVNRKIKNLINKSETSLNQELFLFPLKDKKLYRYAGGERRWAEMQRVVIVASVGLVILLIACFNYINLAVAMNMRRYRETGIKKAVGSKKSIIVYQFLGETFALITLSLLTGVFLVRIMFPFLNAMIGNEMQLHLNDPVLLMLLGAMAIFTGLLSGLFPAFYLASSSPATVLKGGKFTGNSYSAFRQGMIIFQFSIPVALIICMMIIKTQDSYMRNYDVGVDKERLIIIRNNDELRKHAASFRADLLNIQGIEGVSFTNCIPSRNAKVTNDVSWEGKDAAEKLHFWVINTDFDYNKVVNIKMTDGRFFNPSMPSDSSCFLINDVAAKAMKLKNPTGSTITPEGIKGTVIGVFSEFHAIDLAGPFVPVIIRIRPYESEYVLIKFTSGEYPIINDQIRKIYALYNPDKPYEPLLFNDLAVYNNLALPSGLMGIAFIIALLLACMGLYGLASFTSESRTKEIGIRKTHGARTVTIMQMLTTNYFKWLVLSTLIAFPVAFMFGKTFLARFNFHAQFPFLAFVAGPAIAFAVAILTVSSQTWKVANRNPVDALRNE